MYVLDPWLRDHLVCPLDKQSLAFDADTLSCPHGHRYPVIGGVPVMLPKDIDHTHARHANETFALLEEPPPGRLGSRGSEEVDPYVQQAVADTNSNLYRPLVGRLKEYPIPELDIPAGDGKRFLDIGCNWGRWCIAASRQGYRPVGVDPSLEAVLAARRVARQLGREALYVVADSRYLPFAEGGFEFVYSYSVFQHFSKENVKASLGEIRRVLSGDGQSLIQMLNSYGLRSLFVQARRRFREARGFETRYWTPAELQATFDSLIGPSEILVGSFFTQGQVTDKHLFLRRHRALVAASEFLKSVNRRTGLLTTLADNLFLVSRKRRNMDAPARRDFAATTFA